MIQEFILQNHYAEFIDFCEKNRITIFNEDLKADRKHASGDRIACIVFLREALGLRPPVVIRDDMLYCEQKIINGDPVHGHV